MRDALENVADERDQDAHSLAGHPSVGMDLFQDFVNINRKRLIARLLKSKFGYGSFSSRLCFGHLDFKLTFSLRKREYINFVD